MTPRVLLRILTRVRDEFRDDQVALVAAGVAFYWLLAIFPALATGVSVWALFGDPDIFTRAFETYGGLVPPDIVELVDNQVQEVRSTTSQALTVGAVIGFLASAWAANTGVKGIVSGLNVAWDLPETRSFLGTNLVALALLGLAIGIGAVSYMAFAALPLLRQIAFLSQYDLDTIEVMRWPVITVAMLAYLSVLYRVAPCRRAPPRAPVTAGALVATALFLAASAGLTYYVGSFGSYNETYGSLAGVVVLLLWFWVTAISVLMGAEIDAEIERELHQDHLDTVPLFPTGRAARRRDS